MLRLGKKIVKHGILKEVEVIQEFIKVPMLGKHGKKVQP